MNKLYGSHLCEDCPPTIEYLKKKNFDFEFIDITESIKNLKEFMVLRDKRKEFDEAKKEEYINIPCLLMENGDILFYEEINNIK